MSATWGEDAGASLRAYILQHAANADPSIRTVADLARKTAIKPGIFSKWFRGVEQPSVGLLERLAPIIKAPIPELLVLAHRVSAEDLGLDTAPEPPDVLGHPLAREVDALLAEDSSLSPTDRASIETFLTQYLEPWARQMRLRRPTRRRA